MKSKIFYLTIVTLFFQNSISPSLQRGGTAIGVGVGSVGLIIGSIFVNSSGNKKLKKAVDLYNKDLSLNQIPTYELGIVSNSNGIGL